MTHERMSDQFEKWHLGEGRALHRFTGPDLGGPHDHPFDFVSRILVGGYIERVYQLDGDGWTWSDIHRHPGDRFAIQATHIHRIIALPDGECWTLVEAGPHIRTTRFYRSDGKTVESRAWDESWPA